MEGILQPLLFTLKQNPAQGVRSARQLGRPRLLRGGIPLPFVRLVIDGVTKDSTGTPLPSCAVQLYHTASGQLLETVLSDAITGAYRVSSVGLGQTYRNDAYKPGSPDVAGTTVNTLVGIAG